MLSFCLLLTYCTINVSLRFVRVAQVIIIISKQQLKEYSHLDGVERLQPLFGRYTICAQEHIIVFFTWKWIIYSSGRIPSKILRPLWLWCFKVPKLCKIRSLLFLANKGPGTVLVIVWGFVLCDRSQDWLKLPIINVRYRSTRLTKPHAENCPYG